MIAETFDLRRAVTIETGRAAAYVAKPNGTVEAVDLSSGRTLWSSSAAAVPLGLDDHYLVAQIQQQQPATKLRVAVLDLQMAGRLVSEALIALPAGVEALVADEMDRSFRAKAERDGELFVISWIYKEVEIRALPPEPGKKPGLSVVTGAVRILPQTGQVVASESAAADQIPAQWKAIDATPAGPWLAGAVQARAVGGRGGPLTLQRSNAVSGEPLPDLQLSRKAIVAIASSDQQHLLASESVPESETEIPQYRWLIFSLETGELVSDLRRDVSAAPFMVWDEHVIFESAPHGFRSGDVWVEKPLEIRSVRATNGVPAWECTIRDLAYRGPLPPARPRVKP